MTAFYKRRSETCVELNSVSRSATEI